MLKDEPEPHIQRPTKKTPYLPPLNPIDREKRNPTKGERAKIPKGS